MRATSQQHYSQMISKGTPGSSSASLPESGYFRWPTTAAATLWNTHKMKTFVVGFGMQSAGDKATLNTIAVAGGTNQAYFADNEAQLLEAPK